MGLQSRVGLSDWEPPMSMAVILFVCGPQASGAKRDCHERSLLQAAPTIYLLALKWGPVNSLFLL